MMSETLTFNQQQLEQFSFLSALNFDSTTNNSSKTDDEPLKVVCSAAYLPKYSNPNRQGLIDCGEDAFFVSSYEKNVNVDDARICTISIADGVGGYAEMGIDSSMMAWSLMHGIQYYMENEPTLSCKEALVKAYEHIVEENLVLAGGSTACVLSLQNGKDEQGQSILKLTSANLGDSGFLVVRDGAVVYRTNDQTHQIFNMPKQLSVPIDPTISYDSPHEADEIFDQPLELRRGDVIVAFTDGVSDNLFDKDMAEIVASRQITTTSDYDTSSSQSIANDILRSAVVRSRSQFLNTPFAEYSRTFGYDYSGGKLDDITVVVCTVV